MPKLIIQDGPQRGAEFPIRTQTIVGRGSSSDAPLADSSVSRRHAMLTYADGVCQVRDLGSANGTLVNGQVICAPTELHDGDIVGIGSIQAIYRDHPEAASIADAHSIHYAEAEPGGGGAGTPEVLLTMAAPESGADLSIVSKMMTSAGDPADLVERLGTNIGRLVFDQHELMTFVVGELFRSIPGAERALVMVWSRELGRLVPSAARARTGEPSAIVASRTLMEQVVSTRQAILAADVRHDGRYSSAESVRLLGLRSVVCVPIMFRSDLHGVIQIDSISGALPFGKSELSIAAGIASQVGMALAYAKLHETELRREIVDRDLVLAGRIQRRFMPRGAPALPGYSFAWEYRPALAVGGDFYDFLDLGAGLVGLLVGDAAGKGVSAALYAAKLMSDLRYQAVGRTNPAEILTRTNSVLTTDDHEGMFATATLMVLDSRRGRLSLSSAGHPLPLVRDRHGRITTLGRIGDAPLGLDPAVVFNSFEYEINPSDAVIVYTDGIVEAANDRQELYAVQRLAETVRRSDGTIAGIITSVLVDLKAFVGEKSVSDDLTVVGFARNLPDA